MKEISTNGSYKLNNNKYDIAFEYKGQDTKIVKINVNNNKEIINEIIRGKVIGKKLTENGENLANVIIGIFKKGTTEFTIENAIKTTVTQKNGNFEFTDVPSGEWTVKEIQTVEGFALAEKEIDITITENDEVVEIELVNNYIRGEIQGKKKTEDGKGLEGVVIGLFKENTKEFTKENAEKIVETGKNGEFKFKDILYGNWLVKELETVENCVLSDEIIAVSITREKEVVEIELINNYIKANITLKKVDKDYPNNKLAGAEFEVYEDTNKNSKLDKEDKCLGIMTEVEKGIYKMSDIKYGLVFVKEVKAPFRIYIR